MQWCCAFGYKSALHGEDPTRQAVRSRLLRPRVLSARHHAGVRTLPSPLRESVPEALVRTSSSVEENQGAGTHLLQDGRRALPRQAQVRHGAHRRDAGERHVRSRLPHLFPCRVEPRLGLSCWEDLWTKVEGASARGPSQMGWVQREFTDRRASCHETTHANSGAGESDRRSRNSTVGSPAKRSAFRPDSEGIRDREGNAHGYIPIPAVGFKDRQEEVDLRFRERLEEEGRQEGLLQRYRERTCFGVLREAPRLQWGHLWRHPLQARSYLAWYESSCSRGERRELDLDLESRFRAERCTRRRRFRTVPGGATMSVLRACACRAVRHDPHGAEELCSSGLDVG